MVIVSYALGKRLWKWKRTVWTTIYGMEGAVWQPLMEMEGDCLNNQ
jgi:hypothetical protein